ncbi:chaperonin 10-like protein [Desarmillaria tabescens]|uniref:Chaperonin 10-like protein n=1 Tax=Armillaria tabescens TaxID=1929756 RepID=A0AA39K029_ARMTA|nr:chaperonin 10-like protein [Desarmillaria tabescens]KAK0452107.1 chaperonin 10-like protein [Desarmillaria tabescens]
MKALVFVGKGQPMLQVRPRPTILKSTDAIVRMVKTTICGTDLHILKGDVATCDIGRILGHEGVAVVESVGDGVTRFKPGDNVIVSCITSCSSCEYCRKGMPSHCADGGWILGNTIDGTQAEYVRIPHADGSLHLMVEGATAEEQIMISDALPTGFECGVLSGKVSPGCSVAIVGCGPVGISAMVTSQLYSPSQVIMIGRNANRVALAKTMGATHGIVSGEGVDVVAAVGELTNGQGVDTVIEAVGVPETFELCQELIASGGTIANMGVHGCKVNLHLQKLWDKNITITTRLVDTTTTPMLIKLLGSGKIKVAGLVTHRYTFAEVEEAYGTFGAAAKHKAVKVVLNFLLK